MRFNFGFHALLDTKQNGHGFYIAAMSQYIRKIYVRVSIINQV